MYVIAGVSGNTGSVVANTLLSEGHKVRVLVRDAAKGEAWKAKGAEVAVADLHGDEAALKKALEGATGAYVLLPPLMRDDFLARNAEASKRFSRAAKAAGVGHVVLLSSTGAQQPAGTGPILALHAFEADLREAGVPSTFIRAAYFMDNITSGAQPAASDGVYPALGDPTFRYPMVATDDIGRTAAQLLVEGPKGTRFVNLEGPADYSLDDVAAAYGRGLGRPVKSARVPDEKIAEMFVGFGMPRGNAAAYQEMVIGAGKGLLAWEAGEMRKGSVSLDAFVLRVLAKSGKG